MSSSAGRPYAPELRERVMELLEEGLGPVAIARRLQVSRMTVYCYQCAAQQQGNVYRNHVLQEAIGIASCSDHTSVVWPRWRWLIPRTLLTSCKPEPWPTDSWLLSSVSLL
jgi:hypothetical protein